MNCSIFRTARRNHTITAQLKLTDQSGKVLLAFPEEKITSTLLGSIDYSVPGEAVVAGSVIRPVLTANGKTYTDFQTIRIGPDDELELQGGPAESA